MTIRRRVATPPAVGYSEGDGRGGMVRCSIPAYPRHVAMRSLLLVLAVVGAAGCDSSSDEVAVLDDELVVLLVGEAVRIETEALVACSPPALIVDAEMSGGALDLIVRGRGTVGPIDCDGPKQPSTFQADLPAFGEVLAVKVRRGDAADLYEVRRTRGGTFLEAVRTSFSRPGPR